MTETALARRHRLASQLTRPEGYRPGRKTNRRNVRKTETHERPHLRLIFQLPPVLAFSVPTGRHCIGVQVGPLANVSIDAWTFNRDDVFSRAADFLRRLTPAGTPPYTITAVLTSSSDLNWSSKWRVVYVDGHIIAAISPTAPLIFPAPPK